MINAPLPPIPVPFSVSAFVLVKVCPFKSTTAPVVTETELLPNAFAFPACSVPTLTVVAPLYVFAPDSVQVPAPDLVNVPVTVPRMLDRLLLVPVTPVKVSAYPLPPIVPALFNVMPPTLALIVTPLLPSVISPV